MKFSWHSKILGICFTFIFILFFMLPISPVYSAKVKQMDIEQQTIPTAPILPVPSSTEIYIPFAKDEWEIFISDPNAVVYTHLASSPSNRIVSMQETGTPGVYANMNFQRFLNSGFLQTQTKKLKSYTILTKCEGNAIGVEASVILYSCDWGETDCSLLTADSQNLPALSPTMATMDYTTSECDGDTVEFTATYNTPIPLNEQKAIKMRVNFSKHLSWGWDSQDETIDDPANPGSFIPNPDFGYLDIIAVKLKLVD